MTLSINKAPSVARGAAGALLVATLCTACGGAGHRHAASAPHAHPRNGAEPAVSPALTRAPAGRIVSVGAAAEGIIAAPAAGVVAVAVRDPDRITLLSTGTAAVVGDIPIAGPARHLALDGPRTLLVPEAPINRLLELPLPHIASRYRGTISPHDTTAARRSARSIATGSLPHDAAALDGRVFVADEFGQAISVISGDRAASQIGGFVQPGGIADVAGRVALVDVAADTVTLIDPHTLRKVGRAAAGAGPTHDAPGPDGRLYVTDTRGGALDTFATRPGLRRLSVLSLPGRPYGIASDPARGRLWVTETGSNRLVEVDVSAPRPRIVATFPTVRQPNTVAVDPRSGEVYVAGADAGVVQELHP